jgi:hypothetical protein
MRSAKPIVPPLTRFVTSVTTASVAPLSAILCKPFLWKNQAADNNGYLVATKSGDSSRFSGTVASNAL